jgi:DNA-binding NtrC family response regulator
LKALVVEDQPAVSQALCVLLQMHDIPCLSVSSPAQALRVLDGDDVGLVIQDMNFTPGATSGREGIELFRSLRARDPELPVLALTAWTSLETAVQMVKEGASDYLAKPWDDQKLLGSVRTLLEMRTRAREGASSRSGAALREELAREHDLRGLVYESEAMHRVVSLAVQVAAADVPVLITGPNGVGKEKLAEIVQANSRRQDKPFLKVNVGARPTSAGERAVRRRGRAFRANPARMSPETATAARCSSTRSATCRRPARPSSCACCRAASSSGWAPARPAGWTCGCWRRPTPTCATPCSRGSSGRISSSAST